MIRRLLKEPTSDIRIQFFRYFFVGGVAFAVDFGLLYVLTSYVGLHYTLSAAISFTVGLVVNYLVSIHWVFRERTLRSRGLEFVIYGLIGVAGLGLNVLIIWLFTEFIHFHYLVSKIVATAVVFMWNFFSRRFILFNGRGKE